MLEQEREFLEEYPSLILPEPMSFEPESFYGLETLERNFASILLSNLDLVVYREPVIEGFIHKPDFFVFNKFAQKGKLVEITYVNSDLTGCSRETRARKRRQIATLENCGIPYVVLYRENLCSIDEAYGGFILAGKIFNF